MRVFSALPSFDHDILVSTACTTNVRILARLPSCYRSMVTASLHHPDHSLTPVRTIERRPNPFSSSSAIVPVVMSSTVMRVPSVSYAMAFEYTDLPFLIDFRVTLKVGRRLSSYH